MELMMTDLDSNIFQVFFFMGWVAADGENFICYARCQSNYKVFCARRACIKVYPWRSGQFWLMRLGHHNSTAVLKSSVVFPLYQLDSPGYEENGVDILYWMVHGVLFVSHGMVQPDLILVQDTRVDTI